MSGLFFFAGAFFTFFIYHLMISIGRKFDLSICGFSIYNFGLTIKVIIKDIVPQYYGEYCSVFMCEIGTAISISIMVFGIILFTWEGFNLSGKLILKAFIILFSAAIFSIPLTVVISYITHTIIVLPVFFIILISLCVVYMSFIFVRIYSDKIRNDLDKFLIVMNTTLLIPVFIFFSIVTLLHDTHLSFSYYLILFVSNFVYVTAITIRLNQEHKNLIIVNDLLSSHESKKITEESVIEELSNKLNFTTKEFEVAKLIYKGCSNKQICIELHINSESTVKSRVNSLFKKCNISSRPEFFNLISNIKHSYEKPN